MDERQDYRFFWIAVLALLLLTRVPAMVSYLSIDNVNLALSLEDFDPRIHQPQPPGYPFFVLLGRIFNVFLRDAERTFAVMSIVVSALCLLAAFVLARRIFSVWAGIAAVILLLVNPVFWHSGIDGPLRPHLALFSLLTAYCSWRCWNGETRFAAWGAAALGIGGGFRPDLIPFLFPLWLISTWTGTRSWRAVVQGAGIVFGITLVWVSALVFAMGGVQSFTNIMLDYAVDQSAPGSFIFGSSLFSWLRQINRLVIWNALAIVTWIWALPFYFRSRDRLPLASAQGLFFAIWLVPGWIVQALIHVAAPGHTLVSVVALCVLGGYVLSFLRQRDFGLTMVSILNVALFLGIFSLSSGVAAVPGQAVSIRNAMLFGTFETSLGQLRWMDEITRVTLKEIEEFTPGNRPSMIVTTDTYADEWFMNWRIARYYLPERDIWVLYTVQDRRGVQHVRRDLLIKKIEDTSVRLPIFTQGRILWLVEPNSEIFRKIDSVYELNGGRYVFYTDLNGTFTPINIDGIELAPSPFGS